MDSPNINDSTNIYASRTNNNFSNFGSAASVRSFGSVEALASPDNFQCILNRRQRGEKRPIPDEQKDEKYFERRKRNNEAAKKSRDARKLREDRVKYKTNGPNNF